MMLLSCQMLYVKQTKKNLAKLLEKNSLQDISTDAPSPNGLEQLIVLPDTVLKMLRAFPKGTAAGPSGSTATHLLHAIQVNNQTLALDILTDLSISWALV